MGYFPNATAWECWAVNNCFKCAHWPRAETDEPCAVAMAHQLFNYEADEGTSLKAVLDMLIPQSGIETKPCSMFKDRHGLTPRHLRDWAKYKALMAECEDAPNPGDRHD
jgi:hypothetical protein